MSKVVADTGPIIHLSEIQQLPLLKIFSNIYITALVRNELRTFNLSIAKLQKHRELNVDTLHTDSKEVNKLYKQYKCYRVDLADISTIAAAKEHGITAILTDDLELRKAIESSGFQPVGTIGIIIKAYRKNVIADKRTLLQIIDALFEQSSLYVSPAFKKFTLDVVKKLR